MIALQFFGQIETWRRGRLDDLGPRKQIFAKFIGDEMSGSERGWDRLGVQMVIQLVDGRCSRVEWSIILGLTGWRTNTGCVG